MDYTIGFSEAAIGVLAVGLIVLAFGLWLVLPILWFMLMGLGYSFFRYGVPGLVGAAARLEARALGLASRLVWEAAAWTLVHVHVREPVAQRR